MRRRQAAVAALALVGCVRCGVMLNGTETVVKLSSPTPGTRFIVDGVDMPQDAPSHRLTNRDHEVVAVAPDGRVGRGTLTTQVGAGGIVLDLLCSLTIIGVAAPISDLILGGFYYLPTAVEIVPDTPPVEWADLRFEAQRLPRLAGHRAPAPAAPPRAKPTPSRPRSR